MEKWKTLEFVEKSTERSYDILLLQVFSIIIFLRLDEFVYLLQK